MYPLHLLYPFEESFVDLREGGFQPLVHDLHELNYQSFVHRLDLLVPLDLFHQFEPLTLSFMKQPHKTVDSHSVLCLLLILYLIVQLFQPREDQTLSLPLILDPPQEPTSEQCCPHHPLAPDYTIPLLLFFDGQNSHILDSRNQAVIVCSHLPNSTQSVPRGSFLGEEVEQGCQSPDDSDVPLGIVGFCVPRWFGGGVVWASLFGWGLDRGMCRVVWLGSKMGHINLFIL